MGPCAEGKASLKARHSNLQPNPEIEYWKGETGVRFAGPYLKSAFFLCVFLLFIFFVLLIAISKRYLAIYYVRTLRKLGLKMLASFAIVFFFILCIYSQVATIWTNNHYDFLLFCVCFSVLLMARFLVLVFNTFSLFLTEIALFDREMNWKERD